MNKNLRITVPFQITLEHFDAIISAALEGGSNYWCEVRWKDFEFLLENIIDEDNPKGLHLIERLALTLYNNENFFINIYDSENKSILGQLSQKGMLKGLKIAAKDHSEKFSMLIEEQHDASIADDFLQLAVFGKLVFG
jgi:hypothetical protein